MKRKIVGLIMCVFMLWTTGVFAQNTSTKLKSTIEPLKLAISSNKTTNLIFPYAITSVDRGSKDLLVQKAKGVENILQVKAGNASLTETNLTVVVADGSLYSFLLVYSSEPSILNFKLGISDNLLQPVGILLNGNDNEAKIKLVAEKIAEMKPSVKGMRDKSFDIEFRLLGIHIEEGNFLFQLALKNNSNIRYDIEQLRFFIKDKEIAKRTAVQESEVSPVYVFGNQKAINIQSQQVLVFVVPKFTIPDKKYLSIELMEKNGGRHLKLKIKNKNLIKARLIL